MFNIGVFHSKKNCVRNGQWNGGEFRCSVCHRLIATACKIGGLEYIHKFPDYKKYIIPTDKISYIGEIDFSEISDFLESFKNDLNILRESLSGDRNEEGLVSDGEENQGESTGENHDIVLGE